MRLHTGAACANTARESALEVGFRRQVLCRTVDSNPAFRCKDLPTELLPRVVSAVVAVGAVGAVAVVAVGAVGAVAVVAVAAVGAVAVVAGVAPRPVAVVVVVTVVSE